MKLTIPEYNVCKVINVTKESYHVKTKTFVFELSSLDENECGNFGDRKITLNNPKTGNRMEFKFVKKDVNEGDIQGWWYSSIQDNGMYKLLLIND
jgi:hypothetical protein